MKCKKCGHEADPILSVSGFPEGSITVDQEDPDHPEHKFGLDVDGPICIGLEICRNCKSIAGFWIEDPGDAAFYATWGKHRSPLPPNL